MVSLNLVHSAHYRITQQSSFGRALAVGPSRRGPRGGALVGCLVDLLNLFDIKLPITSKCITMISKNKSESIKLPKGMVCQIGVPNCMQHLMNTRTRIFPS